MNKNNIKNNKATLRITEIFFSIQGESRSVGLPTVFIRLTGCPLRCGYCDTAYAFQGGLVMDIDSILTKVENLTIPPAATRKRERGDGLRLMKGEGKQPKHVLVTGGEPLAQENCLVLLSKLCDQNYIVSIETSGALDISKIDPRVIKVMDIKTPGSGEADRNCYENIPYLLVQDQVKFVLCDRKDYDWAKSIINKYKIFDYCEILFSPSHGVLEPGLMADWIVEDRLPVRLQVQLHKYLWGDVAGK